MVYEIYRPGLPLSKVSTEGELMSGEALSDILGGPYINVTHIGVYQNMIASKRECIQILIQDVPDRLELEENDIFPGVHGSVVLVKGICNGDSML